MSLSTSKGRTPWEIQRTFQENKQNQHTEIMQRGANEAMQLPGRRSSQLGPQLSFVAGGEGAMRRGCSVPNWQTEIKNNAIVVHTSPVSFTGCSTDQQHSHLSLKPLCKYGQVFPKES